MANADFNRIKKRVTEILNACPAGTFSAVLSDRNKTRSAEAIEAACYEGTLTVLAALASTANEFRSRFASEPVAIEHGAFLPDHLGDPVKIEIQRYAEANWREADTQSKNYSQIESFRESLGEDFDGNLYDAIPHDQKDSSLAGYADIWENKFYFTGKAARIALANVVRADCQVKLPETMEAVAVKLSVSNCVKAGDGVYTMQIAQKYGAEGRNDLVDFINGRRSFAEVSAPAPVKEVHG